MSLDYKCPQQVFQANPLVTMNTIAKQIRRTIPFTTMDMFDRPLDQINDEVGKEHILRCHGGWCTSVNPFTKSLLDHLGYRTQDILASIPGMSHDTHIATIVWDASHPGSCHLVDPGVRRPFLQAISLDFEKESPIYKCHYARYKFFKEDGDKVLWSIQPSNRIIQKLSKDESITDLSGQKWQVLLRYNLRKPMARYHINKYWQMLLHGNKPVPPGVDGLVFCAFKNDYVVEINATREKIVVNIFDEDSQVERMKMTSEELIRFFITYFPNYPMEMLINAVKADFSWLPVEMIDKYDIGKQSLAV
ncbi:hypothetical protein HOLleu_34480 [Holothuria leucospilota]|uniref:arylamine N-acetyltransferase n=1 Tax=Holothuria leucospilota TaxID=206669 RepID=A0A9Q1BE85_HOLLE|nr:hypothetical protein HOLleu_34480 [Holothuria leucospilota]